METTVDRFGRVVIPKKLREELGLRPGSVLRVDAAAGEILLRPVSGDSLVEREGSVLVFTGRSAGDIDGAVREQREAFIRAKAGRVQKR